MSAEHGGNDIGVELEYELERLDLITRDEAKRMIAEAIKQYDASLDVRILRKQERSGGWCGR